jgi:hypothetical protein
MRTRYRKARKAGGEEGHESGALFRVAARKHIAKRLGHIHPAMAEADTSTSVLCARWFSTQLLRPPLQTVCARLHDD